MPNHKKNLSNSAPGFIVDSRSFEWFFKHNSLPKKIDDLVSTVHFDLPDSVMQVSGHIQKLIIDSKIPQELVVAISAEYKKLGTLLKKAEVYVGERKILVNGLESLLAEIKSNWASQFEPKHLLDAHRKKIDILGRAVPIIVQKHMAYKKTGEIYTSDLSITTKYKLSYAERERIQSIGEKLKEHFYHPQVITWGLFKKKVYIMDIKPMTNLQKSYLVLIRHGRSEYNEKGLWAGWDEPPLSQNGIEDVKIASETLKNIHFDIAYTSHLIRHKQTVDVLKKTLKINDLPVVINDALLERNYGDLTGKNKWEIKKKFGEKQFMKWRRSWADPVPNGESLKQVYERIVPYYEQTILPQLKAGKNVVVASSGNSLRALVKYLENISDEGVTKLEIATGEVYVYQVDEDGNVVNKEIRNQHENKV